MKDNPLTQSAARTGTGPEIGPDIDLASHDETRADTGDEALPERPLKPALRKGIRLRCPRCGEGHLFAGYLRVNRICPACGLELFHQRADDGPAYLTILIVGHLTGLLLTVSFERWHPAPLTLALGASAFAIVASLILLPRLKGMLIALQWAQRLHGF